MEDRNNENDISMIDLNNSIFISNKGSPSEIRNRCRDLVRLNNEPKYKDYIDNLLKESNDNYIKANIKDQSFCLKFKEVNEYAKNIKALKQKISLKEYLEIKKYAISKGGFLTSENRKVFYKKIYLLNHSNTYKMLYIDYKSVINKNWDFDEVDIFSEKRIYDNLADTCEDRTIKADCPRSKILQIAKGEKERENAKLITEDLEKYLILMSRLNNNIYNYFQGYHDLGLYFLLLYHNCPHYAVSVFQRFSEFNLKELLNIKYKKKKMENGRYNMIDMSDTLTILKFIIGYLAPEVKTFFEEKERDEEIKFSKNKNKSREKEKTNLEKYSICDFAFEWIVTLFTRYFENINNVYRIFDYLMVSHSLSIYFLCAEIIIDKFNSLKDKSLINDKAGQHDYFKSIDFDKDIDFDDYINRCEINLNKYIGNSSFENMCKNLKLNKFYPIISEQQPFVEKWVRVNNKQEYTNSLFYYLKGQWKYFKNMFNSDENKNEKDEKKEKKLNGNK